MEYTKYEEQLNKELTIEQKWTIIQFYAEMWEYEITKLKSGKVKRVDTQCDNEVEYFKNVDDAFELAINMLWEEHCENDTNELKKYIKDILGNSKKSNAWYR